LIIGLFSDVVFCFFFEASWGKIFAPSGSYNALLLHTSYLLLQLPWVLKGVTEMLSGSLPQ